MAVTRCQENTGFLVLHRCENPAEYKCIYCGRMICTEHGRPVDATPEQAAAQPAASPLAGAAAPPPPPMTGAMAPPPPMAGAIAPPPPPAGALQNYACQTCLKNRQPQQQTDQQDGAAYYGTPYYHYPYYGSYRPYHSGYYYDYNDRSAFDRDRGTPADTTDALGS